MENRRHYCSSAATQENQPVRFLGCFSDRSGKPQTRNHIGWLCSFKQCVALAQYYLQENNSWNWLVYFHNIISVFQLCYWKARGGITAVCYLGHLYKNWRTQICTLTVLMYQVSGCWTHSLVKQSCVVAWSHRQKLEPLWFSRSVVMTCGILHRHWPLEQTPDRTGW